MRVLSGQVRGRRLKGPAIQGARPTSERVRGAIFNVLGPLDTHGLRVLDLFAGSGSLGIEALSRGGDWADFVERSPRQCAQIRANLSATGYGDRAGVHCMEVRKALESLEGRYHLVLMDPPYELEELGPVLEPLGASDLLSPGARVVVGHSKRVTMADHYGPLAQEATRRYGDSVVDFFRMEA